MAEYQIDIFGNEVSLGEMVRKGDPHTSRKAAVINPVGKSRLRLAVLGVFYELPAATDDEVFNRLCNRPGGPVNQGSVRVRRKDLVKLGWLRQLLDDDGVPIERPSNSGSAMMVWTLTDLARVKGMPDG